MKGRQRLARERMIHAGSVARMADLQNTPELTGSQRLEVFVSLPPEVQRTMWRGVRREVELRRLGAEEGAR